MYGEASLTQQMICLYISTLNTCDNYGNRGLIKLTTLERSPFPKWGLTLGPPRCYMRDAWCVFDAVLWWQLCQFWKWLHLECSPLPKWGHTLDLRKGHKWKYLSPTSPPRLPLPPFVIVVLLFYKIFVILPCRSPSPVCHFLSHLMLKKLPFLRAYISVSIRNDGAVLHTCNCNSI